MASSSTEYLKAIAAARDAYPGATVYAMGDTALYCLGLLGDICVKYPSLGIRINEPLADDSIIVEPKGCAPFAMKSGANWYFCSGEFELNLDSPDERIYTTEEFSYCPLVNASLKRWQKEETFTLLCKYYPKGTASQLYQASKDLSSCMHFDHHYDYIDGKSWSWHNDRHMDLTRRSLQDPALAKMMVDYKISQHQTVVRRQA